MQITWIKKGRGVLLGRDGNAFHVLHDYKKDGDNLTGTIHFITNNAREAAVNYSAAIAERILQELLDQLEVEGYDRHTGKKSDKGERNPCT